MQSKIKELDVKRQNLLCVMNGSDLSEDHSDIVVRLLLESERELGNSKPASLRDVVTLLTFIEKQQSEYHFVSPDMTTLAEDSDCHTIECIILRNVLEYLKSLTN